MNEILRMYESHLSVHMREERVSIVLLEMIFVGWLSWAESYSHHSRRLLFEFRYRCSPADVTIPIIFVCMNLVFIFFFFVFLHIVLFFFSIFVPLCFACTMPSIFLFKRVCKVHNTIQHVCIIYISIEIFLFFISIGRVVNMCTRFGM